MTDEAILYLAYGVVFAALLIFGIALWKAGDSE